MQTETGLTIINNLIIWAMVDQHIAAVDINSGYLSNKQYNN